MADFDERSGIVDCKTPWGMWYQTLDEVSLEINVEHDLKAKNVNIACDSTSLTVKINRSVLLDGKLFNGVKSKGMLWTLETAKDAKILRIVLPKQDITLINTWHSLFEGEYIADDWLLDNMRKKAALEKMQLDNPGFDLSGADITGNYATGGPDVPS